jgi:hypothetical protein
MKRVLLLSAVLVVVVAQAVEKPHDIFEIGGNLAYRLDQGMYKDNTAVSYSASNGSVFPVMGDYKSDYGLNFGVGHMFSGHRADYGVIFKYYYRSSSEQDGLRLDSGMSASKEVVNWGYLREHDLLMTFRISSLVFPYDFLHLENLYIDLGAGISTIVYDYKTSSRNVHLVNSDSYYIGPGDVFGDITEKKTTRSGPILNVGVGYNFPLHETLDLTLRSDMVFGKIQNIEDETGQLVHEGPNVHSMMLSVGLIKHFRSLL